MTAASFNDDITGALPDLRAAAESRMTSECIVRRQSGEYETLENGRRVPMWDVIYEGRCRVRGAQSGATRHRNASLPGGDEARTTPELHFAVAAFVPLDGDLVEIYSGERDGTVWSVINADFGDQQTAMRLPVESTERPEEWD